MSRIDRDLADYLVEAITEDYLLCILISSYTQAKKKTHNLPFGIGKTTLAIHLSKHMNQKSYDWVLDNAIDYDPYNVCKKLKPSRERLNCEVYDDVQATAPASQGVPRAIRRMANFISTERPELACLLMTAPNMNSVASPLRKLVVFEVIVVERGQYEVQKISYHKNYKNPLIDLSKLEYMEELSNDNPFPKLPHDIEEKYKAWRIKQKLALYPSLLDEMEKYVKFNDWIPDEESLTEVLQSTGCKITGHVIKAGHGYAIQLPEELGEELHKKKIRINIQT